MLRFFQQAILAPLCALVLVFGGQYAQAAPTSRPANPPAKVAKPTKPTSRPAPRKVLVPTSPRAARPLRPTPTTVKVLDAGGFSRATAWQVGLDPRLVADLVQRAKVSGSDSFLILRDGKLVGHWTFGRPVGPIETMSVTKSLVGLAIGKLLDEKKIKSLDTPVHTFFPSAQEWKKSPKAKVTIKHLLTHTSGLKAGRNTRKIYASGDFVKFALQGKIASQPGDRFRYNNRAVNLLSGIVKRVSGVRLDQYLQQKIFTPMGIPKVSWTLDKAGNPHAMAGAKLRAIDLAKIGEMMRLGGMFRGKRIISQAWVTRAVTPHPHKLRRWGRATHGLLWWLLPAPYAEMITPALLAKWKGAGMPAKWRTNLSSLLGRTFRTPVGSYFETRRKIVRNLKAALGPEYSKFRRFIRRRKLSQMARVYGVQKGFYAQGYLGQFVVVLPQAKLVIVRQIRARAGLDRFKTGMGTLARSLAKQHFWPAKTPRYLKQLKQLYQLGLRAKVSKKPETKRLQWAAAQCNHASPLVQELAIAALGMYGKRAAFAEPVLLAKLGQKRNQRLVTALWVALGKLGGKKTTALATKLLKNEDAPLSHRRAAATSLGLLAARDLSMVEPCLQLLGDVRSWAARKALARSLVAVGAVMLPRLLVIWNNRRDKRRRQVAEIITRLKLPDAQMVRLSMNMLRDREWAIRRNGRRKLVSMGARAKAALPFFAQMAKRSGGWQARVWRTAHLRLSHAIQREERARALKKPATKPASRPAKKSVKPVKKPASAVPKKPAKR